MKIRIQADDPDVLALTAQAVRESNQKRNTTLTIRCSTCGAELAQVGDYPSGVLFSSWISTPALNAWATAVRGEPVLERHAAGEEPTGPVDMATFARWLTTDTGSEPGSTDRPVGVIALLALPHEVAQDYPDLLVRCSRHGAAVLDRRSVLAMSRASRDEWIINVAEALEAEILPADSGWLR